jgi:XRE family transcriptional regulator, regulator of sulfur utilization
MNDEDFIRELARRVRLHRRYRGLTQQQLGDLTGLSRSFVALFEAGRHGIQVVSLRRVAGALGVAFSALVDDPADQGSPLLTAGSKEAGR